MAEKKIGARIVIEGEQEFRQALTQSKNAMKEFDSEMKLVTAQFKKNEQSMEALKSKQAVYQKQQQELTKQSKLLVEQIEKASAAQKKAESAHQATAETIKKLENALDDAKKTYGENSDEVKDLEKQLAEANTEYDKQERALYNLTNQVSKWNTDLNKTKTQLADTENALDDVTKEIDQYGNAIDEAGDKTKKFGVVFDHAADGSDKLKVSLGSLVSAQVVVDVLRNCANAIKDVATSAIEVGMNFESSMSNVAALSNASGDSLERLSTKAKELGASTMFSASQSADAFSYMALAGWDVEQMLEGIEPVLQLAAAANMDLAQASDVVTDYITAFGLKASDAAHFSDAMARAMSTSNTTVELLAESYKNCAATCGSMGIEMEDATAVLATMANAGVKGGEAGTALNAILTRLATNTKGCADELEKYGVAVYDNNGKMNSISSILNGTANAWESLSQQEQAALAKSIAGVSHFSQFQTIMLGVSDAAKEGGQSFDDYAYSLRNCDGAAQDMAKTMQDNLAGDITILKSALEGLGIATEGIFDDTFRSAVKGATDAVSQLERSVTSGRLGVSMKELSDAIAQMTRNLVDAAEDALPGFIDGLTWCVSNIGAIGNGIETLTTALVTYKVATIAAKVATEGFTVALSVNPYALAAAAVMALIVGLSNYAEEQIKAKQATTEATAETNHFLETQRSFLDGLAESQKAREDEISSLDAQASSSKRLVAELFNETTSNERRKVIISQLKDLYPKLNIQISEEGKLIGATKTQIDEYIDSSLKMAKVSAAKEHLTEIAKQQFEAEQALADVNEEVAQKINEVRVASDKAAESEHKQAMVIGGHLITVTNEYDEATQQAKEGLAELIKTQDACRQSIKGLGDKYAQTLQYIEDNEPIDEAAESTRNLGSAEAEVFEISEDLAKEFEDLYKSISESIAGSLDLTSKWKQEWSTSTSDMTNNIQSQIDGIQNWSDNFVELANSAKVNIDERVLKYLADMGTDGAGLVQELINTLEKSPEQVQDWSNKMAEYLSLEDSVAQEITGSYEDVVLEGINAATKAIEDNSGQLQDAAKVMAEETKNAFKEAWLDPSGGSMADAGKEAAEDLAEGLEEGTQTAQDAGKKLGEQTKDSAEKGLDNSDEIGKDFDKQIADGIKKESSNVSGEAKNMANSAHDAVAKVLSESSGYSIGKSWMSGIAEAIEKEGKKAIKSAQSLAKQANDALKGGSDDEKEKESGGGGDQGGGDQGGGQTSSVSQSINYANGISSYKQSSYSYQYNQLADSVARLEGIVGARSYGSNGNVNVNVELSGDAKSIFNVVRTENNKLKTATGFHALS